MHLKFSPSVSTYIPSLPPVCRTPSGLEDVSKYPALFAGLLASGTWTLDDLKKLAGLNFLRVLREVERVRIFSVIVTFVWSTIHTKLH